MDPNASALDYRRRLRFARLPPARLRGVHLPRFPASSGSAPSPRPSAPGCRRSRRAGWSSSSTKSSFYLGLDDFLGQLPILLFTLIGGVIADRHDRRRLLLGSQYVQMATAFTLAALVYSGTCRHLAHPRAVVHHRPGAGVRRPGLSVADAVARRQEGSAERHRAQLDPVQPRARVRAAARRRDARRVRHGRRASASTACRSSS